MSLDDEADFCAAAAATVAHALRMSDGNVMSGTLVHVARFIWERALATCRSAEDRDGLVNHLATRLVRIPQIRLRHGAVVRGDHNTSRAQVLIAVRAGEMVMQIGKVNTRNCYLILGCMLAAMSTDHFTPGERDAFLRILAGDIRISLKEVRLHHDHPR